MFTRSYSNEVAESIMSAVVVNMVDMQVMGEFNTEVVLEPCSNTG